MNCAIVIATFGDRKWRDLALERALPSASRQGAAEFVCLHLEEATLAEARNRAAEKAESDWLCFLDADDELSDGYLTAMNLAATLHPDGFKYVVEPEVAREGGKEFGLCRTIDDPRGSERRPGNLLLVPAVQYVKTHERRGTVIENTYPPEILDQGRPLCELNWAPIGTLVPRRLFLEVGGFRDLAALEDWELWLRCERAGAKLVPVPDAVYRAHIRPRSRNSDQRLYREIRAEYERAA